MDISSFLKKSEGKNIFIFDGNNKLAMNSYKDELINHLKNQYDLDIKYFGASANPDQVINELQNQSCFGRTLVIYANGKFPLERLNGMKTNFLILELDGKITVKIPKLSNLQYCLLQKKQDVFADLIKYYAKKHSILVEAGVMKALINYFFTNDFSIEYEVLKLQCEESDFFQDGSYSINRLFQSLLYSDANSFFREMDNFTEDESMILIRSLLRNFNIMFEYLAKIKNGTSREIATQEARRLNFYDDRALSYIADGNLSITIIRLALETLMALEKEYKTSISSCILQCGLTNVFLMIKNSKVKP